MRSTQNWREVIKTHGTSSALAHFVTSDLVGYRSTSTHRANDEDTLVSLFQALAEIGARDQRESR